MDVWFSPTMVMEIKATDFLLSSLYTCGINEVEEDRVSLFFLYKNVGYLAKVSEIYENS